jgi:TRAP-type C4-dicarboxylate transport system substrate-binding protein
MKLIRVAIGVLAALVLSGAVNAQTVWKMPTNYGDKQFQTVNNRWFADEVAKRSGNRLKIEVYPNASLLKMAEIMRGVRTGQAQIGEVLLASYGNEDAIFELDSLPFLAIGMDQARKLYQAQRPALEDRLNKRGLRLLYSVLWPGQGIYTRKAVNVLDDFKGLKFRASSPLTAQLVTLAGAQGVVVPLPEVSQAFLTGIVEAMIVSSATIETKPWEYSKYYYTTDAMHPRNAVFVNEAEFSKQPADVQKILLDVGAEAEKRGWQMMEASDKENLGIMKQNGMQIAQPSAEMMAGFRRISDQLISDWQKRAGPDGAKILDAYRAK